MADAVTHLSLQHAPLSRSTRILWLLKEIGCAYSLETLPTGRTLDAVLNPPRPPALRDGEVRLHESGAMSEWLCETRATHLWRAPGSSGRAGWLDWLHFAETMVQHVARKKEASRAKGLAAALRLLSDWLEGFEWLLSGFSGADCQVGYSVWLASQVESLEAYPVAAAYLVRCATRPAFRAAFGGGDVRLS